MEIKKYITLPRHFSYYRYLVPFWKREVFVLILGTVTTLLGLINPYMTKLVIDNAYGSRNLKLFINIVLIGGSLFILNNVISALVSYLQTAIVTKIKFNLTLKVFSKLQTLPYSYFQDTSSGQNLYRFDYDIGSVSSFISGFFPQIIQIFFRTVMVLGTIFWLNWKMALCSIILMPLFYFITWYFNKKIRKKWEESIEINQNVFTALQESLTHIHLIKAFGKEGYQRRKYIKALIKNIRFSLNLQKFQAIVSNIQQISSRLFLGLILLYGGYQVMKGEIPMGSLIAMSMYINQLSGLQGSFAGLSQQLAMSSISCERLDFILNAPSDEKEEKDKLSLKDVKGNIDFKDISFNYTEEKKVLKNLTFSVKKGTFIGLAGSSGCGKTTIINLFLKLYKPSGGEITLDGHNINNIEKKSFYNNIGVALQNSYLWNDTIENNIRYGKINATDDEIREAGKIACIDDFVNNLPDGYKTMIGENACKISEGQRQRISIARAVIKKPAVLILDEGLSSVDGETENKIINNIKAFLKDSTVIIISHRLSTMEKVDLVYFFMNPEKIVAETFEELVKNNLDFQHYLNVQEKEEKEK